MNLVEKIYLPYLLKKVNRAASNGNRKETTAEHTYSTLILAEYFLKKHPHINKEKVMQIILYHDFVEIYAGDTFVKNEKQKIKQEKLEKKAYQKLLKNLPKEIVKDFKWAWEEYESQKTIEGRCAKAMDALDPIIHAIKEPSDWTRFNFTEEKLRKYKEPHLKEFPIIMKFFNEFVKELKRKKLLVKK